MPLRVENRDTARALALELRESTGAHKWLHLCGYILNLTDDVDTLLTILRSVEWSGYGYKEDAFVCPVCYRDRNTGHADDCALALAIY